MMRPRGSPPTPSATSSAIEPVGMTSTGARSSLPNRMTEPFPNCLSIWARADSRAFSRSAGDGMACSFCSRSVACRLSRSAPDGADAATRRGVSCDVVHVRDGLRHPSSLLPTRECTRIDTCCAGAYGVIEQIFDDTPTRAVTDSSASTGLQSPGAVAPLGWDIGRIAQRQPDLARFQAGRQRLRGRAVTQLGQEEIGDQRVSTRAELILHGAVELTASHEAGRGPASAQRELRLYRGDEVVGDDVGEAVDALEHRDAIADFAHDDGDGDVQGFGHRGEDLARCFLLPALDLAEVAERDTRATGDLTEGATLLQTEVA